MEWQGMAGNGSRGDKQASRQGDGLMARMTAAEFDMYMKKEKPNANDWKDSKPPAGAVSSDVIVFFVLRSWK